jgi:2'-5' RNA ligase
MTSYAIWLMPTGEAYTRLSGLIGDLSSQYGGPIFEPHITLLGGLSGSPELMGEKTVQLANSFPRFSVHLTTPGYQDFYFRCLYMQVELSSELKHLYREAQRIFDHSESQPFMPHVSLLYGTFPSHEKATMASGLPQDVPTTFEITALHVLRAASKDPQSWNVIQTSELINA